MDDPLERSEAATAWKRWLTGPWPSDRRLLHEEIASLVGAGFGIREAVADLLARSSGRRRRALARLADAIARDVPPGRAMATLPECFSPTEAAMVAAGEHTGRYDAAFREAAAEVERSRQAATKVLRAVAYPLFLLHFAIVVPACAVVRMQAGATAAKLVSAGALAAIWALLLGVWTLHVGRRREASWGRFVAHLPLAGHVAAGAALSRACRVASALHAAGATLPDTFAAAADAAQNGWIAADLRAAAERVRDGAPAAEALAGAEWLSTAARSLIETGERSGTLETSFARIAEIEEERHGVSLRRLAFVLGGAVLALVALGVFAMFAMVLGRAYRGL